MTLDYTENVIPEGWQGSVFGTPNHINVRYARVPALGGKKATVVLTTGYDEAIEFYQHVAARYQAMGAEVWLMNWHGHGSIGEDSKPHLHDFDTINRHAEDLDFFVKNIVGHDGRTPLIMNTHSIGGYIGMLNLYRFPGVFDAAIMATPFFDHYKFGLPSSARPVFRLAAGALRHGGLQNASLEPVQKAVKATLRTTGRARRVLTDIWKSSAEKDQGTTEAKIRRLIYKSKMPTIGCLDTLLRSYALMTDPNFLTHIETPMLIATAGRDTIVDNGVTKQVIANLPEGLATHVHIRSADHRLFGERPPAVGQWWDHIERFMDEQQRTFRPDLKDTDSLETEKRARNILLPRALPRPA